MTGDEAVRYHREYGDQQWCPKAVADALVTAVEDLSDDIETVQTTSTERWSEILELRQRNERLVATLRTCFEALKATSPYVDTRSGNPYARAEGRSEALTECRALLANIEPQT